MTKKVVYPIETAPRITLRRRTEKDMDEQVHCGTLEIVGEQNNEDPDDRAHEYPMKKPTMLKAEDNPQDPNDWCMKMATKTTNEINLAVNYM